jgi:hypothetical protein
MARCGVVTGSNISTETADAANRWQNEAFPSLEESQFQTGSSG